MRPALAMIAVAVILAACGSSDDSAESVSNTPAMNNPPTQNPTTSPPVTGAPTTGMTVLSVNAAASQEIPRNNSLATATGQLTLDASRNLSGTITTTGVTVTAAHIHDGFAGRNGLVVIGLTVNADSITVPDGTVLTADQQSLLLSGGYYLNIHSAAYPGGELRGQILSPGISVFFADLSADQVAVPVVNDAVGRGFLTLNENDATATAYIQVDNADNATDAHLHAGAPGIGGPIVFPMSRPTTDRGFWVAEQAAVSPFTVEAIKSGETYFNVHLPRDEGLETRGQVLR